MGSLSVRAASATVLRADVARRPQFVKGNSIDAYYEALSEFSRRAVSVANYIQDNPSSTDREVMRGMNFTDMNSVRPRITELLDAGLLVEGESVIDSTTRKWVRTTSVAA